MSAATKDKKEGVKRILPAPVKRAGVAFFKDFIVGCVLRRPRPHKISEDGVTLHLLMSHTTCRMGLLALRSFEWQTGRLWKTYIHDDGSLTQEDIDEVNRHAPGVEVISRARADTDLAQWLEKYPRCLTNRSRHNWFLKFFDCAHYASYENYMVLDTDVIFFKRPTEILEWMRTCPTSCHFMKDARETYASPRELIRERMKLDLWEAVNSGICLMPKKAVDLDLAEHFLEQIADDARHYIFLEQTLFAVAGAAIGEGGTLPATYEISWNIRRNPAGIARHYVGNIKHDLLYAEGGGTLFLRTLFHPSPCL